LLVWGELFFDCVFSLTGSYILVLYIINISMSSDNLLFYNKR
jgi:hypothetical protein